MSEPGRRRFRDTLELEPEFVTALLDTLAVLVVVLDDQGRILRFNRACEATTEYTEDEVKGRKVWELFGDPDQARRVQATLEQICAGSPPVEFTEVWVTRGGERRLIQWSTKALTDQEGGVELVIGTGIDITERQRLLLQEQAARAAAEQAVGLRDDFLSVASHELRSPLTSLQLGVQSLLHMVTTAAGDRMDTEVLRRPLEVASRQADRLARLVNDLLDISRLQAGRFSVEPAPMDLTALVHQVLERFETQLARADCPLVFSRRDPLEGCWDRSRLDQCLSNLLSNAVKYGAGAPVEVRVEALSHAARLLVSDGGIGIPAERHEEIFSRFGRAVSPRDYPGLGLGLYIVRRIVAAHGGMVAVESAEGKGATFVVELPYGDA